MSTEVTQNLTVDFVEKDLIVVDFIEKDLITIDIHSADIATKTLGGLKNVEIEGLEDNDVLTYIEEDDEWQNKPLVEIVAAESIFGETPSNTTALPSKRFVLSNACKDDTLRVYFNGIREKNITVHSNTEFSFGIDIITGDEITVDYIKE